MNDELRYINSHRGVTVKDVEADAFIRAFASFLKKSGKFKVPEWAPFVKTACFKNLAPYDPDWLYVRAAAVARILYIRRSCGMKTLREHFGGRKRADSHRKHHTLAGGKCIRYCLQQLSKMELIGIVQIRGDDDKVINTQGRQITNKGIRDMDRIAAQIRKDQRSTK